MEKITHTYISGARRYRKKFLSEGFAEAFPDGDYCGS